MQGLSPRRHAALLAALVVAAAGGTATAQEPASPSLPNVVFILCDDLGWGDLSCYGSTLVETPHLDRLAREGVQATDFYVAQPVCSASRAAFLTGRYSHRVGILGALTPGSRNGIKAEEVTIADMLRGRGYRTAIFGKWHLGDRPEFLPTRHGFDEFFGVPYSHDMWPGHPESPKAWPPLPLIEGEKTIRTIDDPGFLTTELTRRSVDFIRRSGDHPFFLYLPHPLPHVPLAVSPENVGRTGKGLFADVLWEIDWSVGEILKALEETGVADRTMVVFSSDNGPWLSYGNHAGSAGPLREGKGTTFDGGVRVPFLARLPGRFPEGVKLRAPFMSIDLLPTIAELVGSPVPDRPIDGRSVFASLRDPASAGPSHEAFYFHYDRAEFQALRVGPWKYHLPHGYRSMEGREPGRDGRPGNYDYGRRIGPALFDLEHDVGESEDRLAEEGPVRERIEKLIEAHRIDDAWAKTGGRHWLGADWYANRVQDWIQTKSRIECRETRLPFRTAHQLVQRPRPDRLDDGESISLSVVVEPTDASARVGNQALAGLLVGVGGPGIDHRLSALVQQAPGVDGGMIVALDGRGLLRILDNASPRSAGFRWTLPTGLGIDDLPLLASDVGESSGLGGPWSGGMPIRLDVEIRVEGDSVTADRRWRVTAKATADGREISRASLTRTLDEIDGGVALLSHRGPNGGFAFRDFSLRGTDDAVESVPERAFGPVLGLLYTTDRREDGRQDLRLQAQLPPLPGGTVSGRLVLEGEGSETQGEPATIPGIWDEDSATLRFESAGLDLRRGRDFAVEVKVANPDGTTSKQRYPGRVRPEPGAGATLASLSCIKHWTGGSAWNESGVWFPHADLVASLQEQDPDLLYFAGDAIYEGDLSPADLGSGVLDFHTKWQRFLWTFAELTRTRPTIVVPDDHDVYHGNLWGAGGIDAVAHDGMTAQDAGGYKASAAFVNAVTRCQSGSLPPARIPGPIGKGILPFTTRLVFGPFDIAILSDRMFKDAPAMKVPEGKVVNGFFKAPGFDPRQSDQAGAALLGPTQEAFLAGWADSPLPGAPCRIVASQSPFVAAHTLPAGADDSVVPGLKTLEAGDWPADDLPVADCDTNGWPMGARARAVALIQRAQALHLAGDQHLATLIRYGIDDFDDGPWVFTGPAMANTFPRRWMPAAPPLEPLPGGARGTGAYRDAFGNRMTVVAIANPGRRGLEPTGLHDLSPGYGIVRYDSKGDVLVVEAWPRRPGPASGGKPYEGWPRRLR